jgi:hypothetical protein
LYRALFDSDDEKVQEKFLENFSGGTKYYQFHWLTQASTGRLLKKVKKIPARFHQVMVQIQKLKHQVYEFVPLLDENVQGRVFTFFEEATK